MAIDVAKIFTGCYVEQLKNNVKEVHGEVNVAS